MVDIVKNNDRKAPTFANINLLGVCNVDCYFCLGKDLEDTFKKHNQSNIHFKEWKNFDKFLDTCKENNISKLYLTGQNMDSLQYKYLNELIYYVKDKGFTIGIRTNGYNAIDCIEEILNLNDEIGFSINSLHAPTNHKIMKRWDIPRWDIIFQKIKECRVSVVVNRYNMYEFESIVKYLSQFPSVKYIQARRISTETRLDLLQEDIDIYEELYEATKNHFPIVKEFYGAQIFQIYGKEVCFWRTVETEISSFNFYTDGTISQDYFIIDGYLNNVNKG